LNSLEEDAYELNGFFTESTESFVQYC